MEILFIFLFVVGTVLLYAPILSLIENLLSRHHFRKFLAQETFYHAVVSSHFRYYNRLNLDDQRKFLFRTYMFKRSKKFHYIEVAENAEMPILVSATAVQLTFGLEKYQLGYFRDIYILRDDYHYGFYSRPFQGHVDHSGIYLSWDNFMKGIRGMTPNCNVGLHEMGHALAYVNFITETDEDKHFKREFKQFSKVARPIFNSMQEGVRNVLGDYAGTNYQEFWAVAVEIFFENPVRLNHELPELFQAMTRLLKQDPMKVLSSQRLAA